MTGTATGSLTVSEIWRHPVKSMQGESLPATDFEPSGLVGDRAWAVVDAESGMALTGRREPRLLMAEARLASDGEPTVMLPGGETIHGMGPAADQALSSWLGRPVRLAEAKGAPAAQAEAFTDATDDSSDVFAWTMPAGRFVDLFPVLLITTASLRAGARSYPDGQWQPRRFRPNIVVAAPGDDWLEDAWVGREMEVGPDLRLVAARRASRCTMVTRPQSGLRHDLTVFRTLASVHGADFGVWATVAVPGRIRVGDTVAVADP